VGELANLLAANQVWVGGRILLALNVWIYHPSSLPKFSTTRWH
jgi:hypothetical protein